MLRKASGWLSSCIGYLLYAMGLLVVLLWLLFPKETMRRYLDESLNRVSPESALASRGNRFGFSCRGLTLQAIECFEKREEKKLCYG